MLFELFQRSLKIGVSLKHVMIEVSLQKEIYGGALSCGLL
jgi:hypothetical protein